ncbi:hypothetical protein ACYOEI_14820 [Singulisphaera rosea]
MGKVPFRREIEDLFASDKSIALKMIAGAFVGVVVTMGSLFKEPGRGGLTTATPVKVAIAIIAAAVGAIVVLGLSLRDVVVRRVDQGKRVNFLLRAYFGQGNGCLMLALWFITVIVITLIVTIFTAKL